MAAPTIGHRHDRAPPSPAHADTDEALRAMTTFIGLFERRFG
ncbi:hypothetical protein [Komagataeibacter saccharivorans]|nr:hypothetical protein [Komagataeibacter saccharivorans]